MFCDARQAALVTIGHKELCEMTKRAVITIPTADLNKPRPMTIEGGITMEELQQSIQECSPGNSDQLSLLLSYSVTPPSPQKGAELQREAETHDPWRKAAALGPKAAIPNPSGADGPVDTHGPFRHIPSWEGECPSDPQRPCWEGRATLTAQCPYREGRA